MMDPSRIRWIANRRFKTLSNRLVFLITIIGLIQFLITSRRVHEEDSQRVKSKEHQPPSRPRRSPEDILELLMKSGVNPINANSSVANEWILRSIANHNFANNLGHLQRTGRLSLELRQAFEEYALLPCTLDSELLDNGFRSIESLFVASVIRDVEISMPNFIVQISRLILRFPRYNLFISIYESGSRDSTARWLIVLKRILELVHVPHKIIVNGSFRQLRTESRSEFLSRIRSIVLQPLRNAFAAKKMYKKLTFIDGVFFCAQHLARLNTLSADIACGLNFEREMKRKDKNSKLIETGRLVFRGVTSSVDISGRRLKKDAPFLYHKRSLDAMLKGQPFAVHACWNGIVLLKVDPFYRGVSFHGSPQDKCPASETIQLCEDFVKTGFSRVVIDPGVRVAKKYSDVMETHQRKVLQVLPFRPVANLTNPVQFPRHPGIIECCQRIDHITTDVKSCRTYTFH